MYNKQYEIDNSLKKSKEVKIKKKDLEKIVRANGAKPGKGSNHDKWYSKNGYMFTIPRHKEIGEALAKRIIIQSLM